MPDRENLVKRPEMVFAIILDSCQIRCYVISRRLLVHSTEMKEFVMRIVLLAIAAFVLLFWGPNAHAEVRAPDLSRISWLSPSPTINTFTVPTISRPAFSNASRPVLSQGDPAWRSMRLGRTTVGRSGCLVMALRDALVEMGVTQSSPDAFVSTLSRNGLFTAQGSLYWSVDKLFPVTVRPMQALGRSGYIQATKHLAEGKGVLLEVTTKRNTRHWVMATKVVNGDDIEIRDPNGGRVGSLKSLYGVQSLRRIAVISRKA
jgi:hypothetical protein